LTEKILLKTYAKEIIEIKEKREQELELKRKFFYDQLTEDMLIFDSDIKALHESVDKVSKYTQIEK